MGKSFQFGDSNVEYGITLNYNAEPTPRLFHASNAPVRALLGPYGSGKSTACIMELIVRAMQQEPFRGVRSTRFAIIRQTFPQLTTTTIKSVTSWLNEKTLYATDERGKQYIAYSFTIVRSKPMVGSLVIALPDKTVVNSEWVFISMDDENDSAKLRSMDITMGWINEASEIAHLNFTTLKGRCGRFPAVKDGGCTYHGVILDSNPPPCDSWIFSTFETEKPTGYVIWHQPPGVLELPRTDPKEPIRYVSNMGQDPNIPKAENLQWLPKDYYINQTHGASREFIRVFLMGEYGQILAGKPVYPEFRSELHIAKEEIAPMRGLPLDLAFDFGGQPTCVIGQVTPRGQLVILDELCSGLNDRELEKVPDKSRYFLTQGIRKFAIEHLKPYLNSRYGGMQIRCTGDPAGSQRTPTDETTCHQELAECGFDVVPYTLNNNFFKRREAVEGFMMRINGLLVSPRAYLVMKGFQGGYRWKMVNTPSGETTTYNPEKNIYSHCHDCVQYLALQAESVGCGGGVTPFGYGGNNRNTRRETIQSGRGAYI
jgi:hypothetical protein